MLLEVKPRSVWPQSQAFYWMPVVLSQRHFVPSARGHLEIYGDIFDRHNSAKATYISWVAARDTAKYPTRQSPAQRIYLAQVNNAKVVLLSFSISSHKNLKSKRMRNLVCLFYFSSVMKTSYHRVGMQHRFLNEWWVYYFLIKLIPAHSEKQSSQTKRPKIK